MATSQLSQMLLPESPVVGSAFPSPDLRSAEASTSRLNNAPSYTSPHPSPRFLTDPTPSTVLVLLEEADRTQSAEGDDLSTTVILRHVIRCAVEHADLELIAWMVALQGRWAEMLNDIVKVMADDDGWGLVGMAVQSSCGRQETEEGVRAIISRWGLETGPRGGRDNTGWTPLHLAALISTPPLISFLLTRGASPHALTNRGLTPLDLVSGMYERSDAATLLQHATFTGCSASVSATPQITTQPNLTARRQAMLHRRRQIAAKKVASKEQEDRNHCVALERERWLIERARATEVDPELLLPPPKSRAGRRSDAIGVAKIDDENNMEEGETDRESDTEDEGIGVIGAGITDDSMLVFGLSQLPSILDILITSYRPHCLPLSRRSLPANALSLYARFAHYRCDETWLEELIEGAMERIEQGVYGNVEDLAHLAFWAYNTTMLLHLLKSDAGLRTACEELNLLSMMEELINAIHVFVIRIAERRIDAILDAALLDQETLEDFDDVRFEGEWTLFRSFGSKKQRASILPKASSVFANGNSPASAAVERAASSGRFGSLRDISATSSPLKTPSRSQSKQDVSMNSTPQSTSMDSIATVAVRGLTGEIRPVKITDTLSGVLLVLQLYEVNPAFVVQAFSQIFFWIASELFNRILTRKNYLCRSKAVQIRMNITVLDDWVRSNGLPAKTATKHLEPVTQLLQWLQCSSQIKEFDTLIGTMQNMKAINPLQMRRAVRDYRFEVNEGKMTEECAQYLAQLQKDWERRKVATEERRNESDGAGSASNGTESTPLDALFDGTTALADFEPQSGPECHGELIDSRYMLPFLLPADNAYLVATPPPDAAFQGISTESAFLSDGSRTSRPPSRSSFSSSRPLGWAIPDQRKLRQLPPDFFTWLKDRKSEIRHHRHVVRPKDILAESQGPMKVELCPRPTAVPLGTTPTKHDTLPLVTEDEQTPVPHFATYSTNDYGFPSQGLHTSPSRELLRGGARIPFGSVEKPSHSRSDSYELKPRSSLTPLQTPHSVPLYASLYQPPPSLPREPVQSARTNGSPIISLKSMTSPLNSSKSLFSPLTSPTSLGSESGKKWWKLGGKMSSDSLGRRKVRNGIEDTVGPGVGIEGRTPPVGKLEKVWER